MKYVLSIVRHKLPILVVGLLLCVPQELLANSRRDVASAYLVCSSIGRSASELQERFAPNGVIFEHTDKNSIRIGWRQYWFFSQWLCRLSTDSKGVVTSAEKYK